MFTTYLSRWNLEPDGEAIITDSSRLLPVVRDGVPAILKVAVHHEEQAGNRLMVWWRGRGAARVLDHDDDALLMERADGSPSLAAMSVSGRDDKATEILCRAVLRLHEIPTTSPPDLVPLSRWFASLRQAASERGGVLGQAWTLADSLLRDQRDVVVLHGDIHHDNVLWFGDRGWLVIDPKGLRGDRCFDYANLFCNPDANIATSRTRFLRRIEIVSETAGLERTRLLSWIAAHAALSATWLPAPEASQRLRMEVAALAIEALQA